MATLSSTSAVPGDPIMARRSVRVAAIGAGAAGLAAARELRGEGHVVVVFEQGAGVGGTWGTFDTSSSSSEDEDPRRYPAHQEVLRYIQKFARRFELYGLIRFRTKVIKVTACRKEQGGGCWIVTSSKEEDEEEEEEEEALFDAVVV